VQANRMQNRESLGNVSPTLTSLLHLLLRQVCRKYCGKMLMPKVGVRLYATPHHKFRPASKASFYGHNALCGLCLATITFICGNQPISRINIVINKAYSIRRGAKGPNTTTNSKEREHRRGRTWLVKYSIQ